MRRLLRAIRRGAACRHGKRHLASLLLLGWFVPAIAHAAPPPPAVTVVPVKIEDVAPVYSYVGHVAAIQTVQIKARVTAFIQKIAFDQGSDVKAQQVLFELQKAPYQAALQSAQAALDKAQANSTQAQLAYQRSTKLNTQGFEAQAALDQARATAQSAAADVLAAKAQVATAALNLSYCTIRSPIDGRIGAATYTVGNLVTPSSEPLATVNQLDPIRVVFSVSENDLITFQQKTGASGAEIAQSTAVDLQLANGSHYDHTGSITFINNQVDPATGTVTVFAKFANPKALLLPNAFVTVEVHRAKPRKRPVVPVAAVQDDKHGKYVLVVGPDSKVKQQQITIGRQVIQDFIVTKGLSGGERVIVEGVQKVRPGETVKPVSPPSPARNAAAAAGQRAG